MIKETPASTFSVSISAVTCSLIPVNSVLPSEIDTTSDEILFSKESLNSPANMELATAIDARIVKTVFFILNLEKLNIIKLV